MRMTPLSTKMHVRRSPIGAVDEQRRDRGIDAAAETADDAAVSDLSRGCVSVASCTNDDIVQSPVHPQTSYAKLRRMSGP